MVRILVQKSCHRFIRQFAGRTFGPRHQPAHGAVPLGAGIVDPHRLDCRIIGGDLLRQRQPQAFSVMAWVEEEGAASVPHAGVAVGLVNCFEGFSTFACKPLVNVHDVVVVPAWRGHRIAQRMLQEVETLARGRGACKLTLEVLSGNRAAIQAYEREGCAAYALYPRMGSAQFFQKLLLD